MIKSKLKKSSKKVRTIRQIIMNNILKANQSKSLIVLLLHDIETTIKVETKVKMLLNKFNLIKCLSIDDATKIAKNKNLYLLQRLN